MTGVDTDLATLHDLLLTPPGRVGVTQGQDAYEALARVEAELSRLRGLVEGSASDEAILQAAEARCARLQQALRGLLREWPDGECFCGVRGTDGGVDHMPGCAEAREALAGPGSEQSSLTESGSAGLPDTPAEEEA